MAYAFNPDQSGSVESKYIALPSLTVNEIRLGAFHAVDRRTHNLARPNRVERSRQSRYPWDDEIQSILAEMAFCKWKGIYWTGLSAKRAIDCGLDDVRWTNYYGTGGLIVYTDNAPDAQPIVLLDGFAPDFRVIGWAFGREVKQSQFWVAEKEYFLMPRRFLHVYVPEFRS